LKSIDESISDLDSITNSIMSEAQHRSLIFIEKSFKNILEAKDDQVKLISILRHDLIFFLNQVFI
jgi:hypothetical protein